MKKIFLSILFAIVTTFTYSQIEDSHSGSENQQIESNSEHEEKYKIALTLGVTHIPAAFEHANEEDAVFVPTIGIDFFYKIRHKWSLGLMTDLELGDYITDFKREELNREYAIILCLLGGYEIRPNWMLQMGGGMEFEKHENLFVFRAGTEYEFNLEKNWNLSPTFFFDFKENYDTWTLGLGIGKRF